MYSFVVYFIAEKEEIAKASETAILCKIGVFNAHHLLFAIEDKDIFGTTYIPPIQITNANEYNKSF